MLPVLNQPFGIGEGPPVTVWVVPLLVHLTIQFAPIVTPNGLNAKLKIETFVVPDAGHNTLKDFCVGIAVKLMEVISRPIKVCVLLVGPKVNPVLLGVMV